jgi:hypothetical protein
LGDMSRVAVLCAAFLLFLAVPSLGRPGTTLETAFIRAYNERVADGTWVDYFGDAGLLNQDYCPGTTSIWEWPSPVAGSDLSNSLQSGVFRCTYNGGQQVLSPTGATIIDTTGYKEEERPVGLIVDWFDQLASTISEQYGVPFAISWNTSLTDSNAQMSAVLNGDFDACCGKFSVGAGYSSYGARGEVFSVMYCPTYLENPQLYMLKSNAVSTWAEFIDKVNQGWIVYANGSPGGGTEQSCTALLLQYTSGVKCHGNTTAFAQLIDGNCNAVFGSSPSESQASSLSKIGSPVISSQGTLFRPTDVNGDALATTIINVNIA